MRIVVIGGTGHIGTFLIPRLVLTGHEVICVSRQERKPYLAHPAWDSVEMVTIDRDEAELKNMFGTQIRNLSPDAVIDLICFTPESAQHLAEALKGHVQHFLHCGTIWVHGHSEVVPTDETQFRKPICDYGTKKAAIESYLLTLARKTGFPATILHPGHIVGPGWVPVNPVGTVNPETFKLLAEGKEVVLPNLGMETLHHVHADDVAASFCDALNNWNNAVGESFHIVSSQALTLRGYANAVASWFGKEARLSFIPWEEWKNRVSADEAEETWDHIAHSPNCSIEKARRLLNYNPRYTSLQAIEESVKHFMNVNN
jgi:nucleoside-diphosphate-sugar epimerase